MQNLSYNMRYNKGLLGYLKSIFTKQKMNCELAEIDNAEDYISAIRVATQELENMEQLFNNTSDPDLINYVIYAQNAVNMKFSYLIKKAREKDIRSTDYVTL